MWLRSGGEHSDPELAVGSAGGGGGGGGGGCGPADIKSNNPHLTGGEIYCRHIVFILELHICATILPPATEVLQ